jgi:hypothetical protein
MSPQPEGKKYLFAKPLSIEFKISMHFNAPYLLSKASYSF